MQMRMNTTPHIPWASIPGAEFTAPGFRTLPSGLHKSQEAVDRSADSNWSDGSLIE